MKLQDLKIGEIYAAEYHNNRYIFMPMEKNTYCPYLRNREHYRPTGDFTINGVTFSEATYEEKQHLSICHERGKFVKLKKSKPQYLIFN